MHGYIYQIPTIATFFLCVCVISFFIMGAICLNSFKAMGLEVANKSVSGFHIPVESIWNVDVNGTKGNLTILHITNTNIFQGLMHLSNSPNRDPVLGAYDNVSEKLTFFRIMDFQHPIANQVFTGFLMGNLAKTEIAGYFEALPDTIGLPSGSHGAGGSVDRTIFGWYGAG
jgi:hypothetical protein